MCCSTLTATKKLATFSGKCCTQLFILFLSVTFKLMPMCICSLLLFLRAPRFLPSPGREHHELDIFIFREVVEHMARVDRVLTFPGGSLLLAGSSGVGRRTAVKLVAHMHHMDVVTPHISRSYTIKNFKSDLKSVSQPP